MCASRPPMRTICGAALTDPKKSLQTLLTTTDYRPPEGFGAFPTAIHHASTVLFKDVAALRARNWQDKTSYTYGLHGTPTTFTLEARLAEIEGGTDCLLAPSGLAAIAMVDLALLKAGDDFLIPDNVYNPNRELANWLQKDFGITARFYDPLVGDAIADLIQPNTKLIWVEAPPQDAGWEAGASAGCRIRRGSCTWRGTENSGWWTGSSFVAGACPFGGPFRSTSRIRIG